MINGESTWGWYISIMSRPAEKIFGFVDARIIPLGVERCTYIYMSQRYRKDILINDFIILLDGFFFFQYFDSVINGLHELRKTRKTRQIPRSRLHLVYLHVERIHRGSVQPYNRIIRFSLDLHKIQVWLNRRCYATNAAHARDSHHHGSPAKSYVLRWNHYQ